VRRPPGLRALAVLPAVLVLVGCGGTRSIAAAPAAGHYPVATAPPEVLATPVVSDGHFQLVAAGEPVVVRCAGAVAVVEAARPDLTPVSVAGQPPVQHAAGTLTVTVRPSSGSLRVPAAGFLALDQAKNQIPLRADRASSTADARHPATVRLSAVFPAGHTTLTWQPAGKPLVTWDFMVELD